MILGTIFVKFLEAQNGRGFESILKNSSAGQEIDSLFSGSLNVEFENLRIELDHGQAMLHLLPYRYEFCAEIQDLENLKGESKICRLLIDSWSFHIDNE